MNMRQVIKSYRQYRVNGHSVFTSVTLSVPLWVFTVLAVAGALVVVWYLP